ncbi:MAG: hypothetical protein U0271_16690 [Polyangiaceae bacterium]
METGSKGPALRIETLSAYLDDQLDNEAAVLDVLVVAMARGQSNPELWDKLHAAALRDDRLSELAFAYEKLNQDRRVRIMPPAHQAQIFLNAARFFVRALGDIDGAQTALERVLALAPGHPEAFSQLQRILEDKGETDKLVALHLAAVGPKTDKETAVSHLRAALNLVRDAEPEKAVKIAQQLLRLDPSDPNAVDAVCAGLEAANKFGEVARALEQSLQADPPPSDERKLAVRLRLLALYDDRIPEIERAIGHVEEVLGLDPANEIARKLANRLLANKVVGARAAGALERVFEAEGNRTGVAQMLGVQIEQARGPKRAEAQRRLGLILLELGEDATAYTNFEAVLTADPSDDVARGHYVVLARQLGKQADASKLLQRAAAAVKDAGARTRINLESARFLAELGDPKRARVILQGVLEQAEGEVLLEAARTMRTLVEEPKALAPVLEIIAKTSPEPAERLEVLNLLSTIYESDLKDLTSAIQARKRALELDPDAEPSELERLLEARGDFATLAEVLEIRANRLEVGDERRELLMRAAFLKVEQVKDLAGGLALLLRIRAEHGAARDIHAELLPLLEAPGLAELPENRAALVEVLDSELHLAEPEERAVLLARLGEALLAVDRVDDAVSAFAEVLEARPDEARSRAHLTALMQQGTDEVRLRAASILAPVHRGDDDHAALVAALEVVADLHGDPQERMAALAEAHEGVRALNKDKIKALFLAGRGLREAVTHDLDQVPSWLERIGPSDRGPSKAAIAETLASALRDRKADHPSIARLAQRTGEAYAECADSVKAIEAYRRVLELEPDNEDILERVDHLLAEQGSPDERISLYRAALARPGSDDRKRGLFLAIGKVQRESLQDVDAALAAYREGLELLPADHALRAAVLSTLEGAQRFHDLYQELLTERTLVTGALEGAEVDLRLADTAVLAGETESAVHHYREALATAELEVDMTKLASIEEIAQNQVDVPLLVAVAERYVHHAGAGAERASALEKLGSLVGDRSGDPARAAEIFFQAAEEAAAAEDVARATRDYERVLAYQPATKPALERLVDIHAQAGDRAALLNATKRLVALADSREEGVALVMDVAALADPVPGEAPLADEVLSIIAAIEERFAGDGAQPHDTAIARANVLARAGRIVEAASTLASLLAATEDDHVIDSLDALLASHAQDAALVPIRRDLLEHRADRASGDDARTRRLELFRFERDVAKDAAKAAASLDRLLEEYPSDDEVLADRQALEEGRGEFAGAAQFLQRRIDVAADDDARARLSCELARLHLDKTGDVGSALDAVESFAATHAAEPTLRRAALAALEAAQENPQAAEFAGRAAAMLEQIAEALTEPAERATIFEAMLRVAKPEALGGSEGLGRLYQAWLGCLDEDPAAALEVAATAARRVPDLEEFWDRAEELARTVKRPMPVAEAYRAVLEGARSLPEEVSLRIGERGVAFHEEWFDDAELVTKMLRLIVDVAPSATWAFERLKLIYNAAERWQELFDLYDHVIATQADDESRSLILEDAVDVARDLAGDNERAIRYLERLRDIRPTDTKLEAQLERLYERHNKPRSLIDLLMARVPRLNGDDARATRLRVAGLWETALEDLEQALEAVQPLVEAGDEEVVAMVERWLDATAREESPASVAPASTAAPASLARDAASRKKRLRFRRLADAVPGAHPMRKRAAALLEPLYALDGNAEKAARALEISLEFPMESAARVATLRELAERRARLGDGAGALAAALAEVALSSSEEEEHAALDAVLGAAGVDRGLLGDVVNALRDLGEVEPDRARSLRLLRKASSIARADLADDALAITIDLAILARSDEDPDAARAAARKLDDDLRAAGREAERCAVLERLAELEEEPAARRAALVEAARIAEEVIGDRERAVASLRAWLEQSPSDLEVLTKLVDNLRLLGDSRALVAVLTARADSTTVAEDAQADRVEIARIHARILGDAASAIAAYQTAIDKHGATDDLVDELDECLQSENRLDDLSTLLRAEVARVTEPERKSSLAARLGEVERRRNDTTAALSAFVIALKHVPSSARAQGGLETLIGALSPKDPEQRAIFAKGVRVLATSFTESGQLDRLLALAPARLLAADDDLEKCAILMRAAELEEELGHGDLRALERTLQAFSLRPEVEGLAAILLTRAQRSGRWDLVAPHLLPALATREDIPADVARNLLVFTSDWASGAVRVAAPAPTESAGLVEGLLAAAHARVPSDVEVLKKLVAHRRSTPGQLLVDALLALATLKNEDAALLREAATVALRTLGDHTAALAIADRLRATLAAELQVDANDEAEEALAWAVEVIDPILRERGELPKLKDLYLTASALKVSRARSRAYIAEAARLSTPEQAITLFEKLYADDPSDVGSAEELAALYEKQDKKRDLARLYGSMAEGTTEPENRARLRLLQAELLVVLGVTEQALGVLRKSLGEYPLHEPSVRLFVAQLEKKGSHAELCALSESQGELLAKLDAGRALAFFQRASSLADTQLKDVARAAKSFRRVVDLDPSDENLDAFARLLERAGQNADEAAVLERLAEARRASGSGVDDELSLRLATAYGRAGQVERAREKLERAVQEGRASSRVRDTLATIYRGAEAWEPLAKLLEDEAESAPDVPGRIERLRDAAQIYAQKLDRPSDAVTLLERASSAKPDDLPTLFALADALRMATRSDEARAVLGRILAEFGTRKPKERALVHFEIAKLALANKDKATALTELDAASKIDPAHGGVLRLLGEVAIEEGQFLRAQRTYRALLLVLRAQRGERPAAALAGTPGAPVSQAHVLVELAFIAERQKEADRKNEFIESAFEATRDNLFEQRSLVFALERRGYHDLVARAVASQLDDTSLAADERARLSISLAELKAKRLNDPDEAVRLALSAFELVPRSAEIEARVRAVLSELGQLGKLFDVLRASADAAQTEPSQRADILLRAALIAEHELHDELRAVETLEAVLEIWSEPSAQPKPADRTRLLAHLEDLLSRLVATKTVPAERHAAILEQIVELATQEGAAFAAIADQHYRLYEIRLADARVADALALLERAAREDADGDRLENRIRAGIAVTQKDPRFARLLEDFARERGRKRTLIDALELLSESELDPVPNLREAYEVSLELEEPALSERLLRRIVPTNKDDDTTDSTWALNALAELRFGQSDAREAADLWERAARVSDPNEERAILLRVADLAARVLDDLPRAISLYETLRKREPADREVWQPLADLHRKRNDTDSLAALIDETIPLVDEPRERATMRLALAKMIETTDPDRAADVLAEAIDEDASNTEAAQLLERLYEATGRDDKLIVLLERQLDVAKDAEDKPRVVALYHRLAALRERGGDEDAALDAFHGALDWDDKNLAALRAVVRLHSKREDSIALGDLLDRLLELETGDAAVELAIRSADAKLEAGDPPGAERALLTGFKANPRSPVLKQRLTELYTERNDKVGLARISAVESRFVTDPKIRKDLLLAAAETMKTDGDAREAVELYDEALTLDRTDRDTLFAFMDACANSSQHQRAIDAVATALAADPSDAWLLFSRAVLREAIGQSDAALDDLEAAFDKSGGQYAQELRAHLEAALGRIARDPNASRRSEADIQLRLAEVSAADGDIDGARNTIDEVLRRSPQDVRALRSLGRIEELATRFDAAALAYARAVGLAKNEELTDIAIRLFECAQRSQRLSIARPGLERAVAATPDNVALRTALRAIYEETGAVIELAELLTDEARRVEDTNARFDKLLEAARLLLYGTGESSTGPAMAERALAVLDEARNLKPEDQDCLQLCSEALATVGRPEEARNMLGAIINSHKGKRSRELGQAFYALYRVESKSGNLTEALEALVKAFDNQPQNGGIALELGQLAIDLDEQDVAQRAFRAVTLLKSDGASGVSPQDRAIAYFHLGSIAARQGDARRAKMMLDKSLAEDPNLDAARELLRSLGV